MLKARQRFDKYRIERKVDEGGFAVIYQALDTLEGVRVALKIPHDYLVTDGVLNDFRHEIRLAARLQHDNILPLKNASFIKGKLVVVYALGERSLAERLKRRLSVEQALDYAQQMISAVACAHENHIIHCDIKPENMILFADNRLCLTDFGIAKVAQKTIRASGSGTVGYIAPEQAMGKPSFRSDVFSLGLIIYRMLTGVLPEWPFEWPPPGYDRLRGRVHPELMAFVRRAMQVDPRKRFRDAITMRAEFERIRKRSLRFDTVRRKRKTTRGPQQTWRQVRWKQFQRAYGKELGIRHQCEECAGPVSEEMAYCPWCGVRRDVHRGETGYAAQCPRCHRGMKLDWKFCPWCYGSGFEPLTTRNLKDARYQKKCANSRCTRKELLPFMRYCPWCNRKVRKTWQIADSQDTCDRCGWGVLRQFWSRCPWCGKALGTP